MIAQHPNRVPLFGADAAGASGVEAVERKSFFAGRVSSLMVKPTAMSFPAVSGDVSENGPAGARNFTPRIGGENSVLE